MSAAISVMQEKNAQLDSARASFTGATSCCHAPGTKSCTVTQPRSPPTVSTPCSDRGGAAFVTVRSKPKTRIAYFSSVKVGFHAGFAAGFGAGIGAAGGFGAGAGGAGSGAAGD